MNFTVTLRKSLPFMALCLFVSFASPGIPQTKTDRCTKPVRIVSANQSDLPDGTAMMQAYREMMKNTASNSDIYTFDRSETDETRNNSDEVVRTRTWDYRVFFVNGYGISEIVAVNGKPVSPAKLKQELKAAMKEVAKDGAAPPKQQYYSMYYDSDALEHGHLEHPQRLVFDARPAIAYDLAGNLKDASPNAIKDYEGTALFDEKTHALEYLAFKTLRELKFSGDTMSLRPGFKFSSRYAQIDGSPLWIWSCAHSVYDSHKGPFNDLGQNYWNTSNIRRFSIQTSTSEQH